MWCTLIFFKSIIGPDSTFTTSLNGSWVKNRLCGHYFLMLTAITKVFILAGQFFFFEIDSFKAVLGSEENEQEVQRFAIYPPPCPYICTAFPSWSIFKKQNRFLWKKSRHYFRKTIISNFQQRSTTVSAFSLLRQ